MFLSRSLELNNNDTYELGITKDYIVVNDGYTGIIVYDKQFNKQNVIKVADDLMIYHLYTSLVNNFVVIFDAEKEHLYVADLFLDTVESVVATDGIYSVYYYVEAENFRLRIGQVEYALSYKKIEKRGIRITNETKQSLLANFQDELVFGDSEGNIYYKNEKVWQEDKHNNETMDKFVAVNQDELLIYDEVDMFIYNKSGVKNIFKTPHGFTIRKAFFKEAGSIIILLNSKGDVLKSTLEEYQLPRI
ncbi:hypothetical protein HBP99_17195 [Listeria booriae]|uniref:hypothetical protein n=1 Tax=Listeria booriae TaxID=1552123 RepID=UPI00162809FF|nr:hypothetical protein [Listeria booriae]MBC2370339.1 hypothetical protein [Listeria booriae]